MVASRWPYRLDFLAAAIKRSISAVVRYSRVRTEEFTVVGADGPPVRFSTIFWRRFGTTGELLVFSSLVSIGAVGIHRKSWAQRMVSSEAWRGLRSSRADSGPQVLPPARVTVPLWPH